MSDELCDALERAFEETAVLRPFAAAVNKARGFGERLTAIKRYYAAARTFIDASPENAWGVDFYEINWPAHFTPIESALWSDIRCLGAVLYPQFPVGRFVVDFGNPAAKVAIECDGKWHIGRETEDAKRQAGIEKVGWTVYRISGKDCFEDSGPFEDADIGLIKRKTSAGEALVREVIRRHGIGYRMAGDLKEAA